MTLDALTEVGIVILFPCPFDFHANLTIEKRLELNFYLTLRSTLMVETRMFLVKLVDLLGQQGM